jgi:hypothetical protein
VTRDRGSDFPAAIRQEKSKENGNHTCSERDLQKKTCGLAEGLPPRPRKLDERQDDNHSDGKMHDQRMEAAEELQPVSVGFTVKREKERQEQNENADTSGPNPNSRNQACPS